MGAKDLDKVTPLFFDMHICVKFLHCSHEEFLKLPRLERKKLRMFAQVEAMKQAARLEEMEQKQKERDIISSAPQTQTIQRKSN
jgi:hypothetical protein